MGEEWSSATGGELSQFVLRTVFELSQEHEDGAPRGEILIAGVEAGYEPDRVEEELTKQLMKGRVFESVDNRYSRIR